MGANMMEKNSRKSFTKRKTGKISIEERACELANYIIETKETVRNAAKLFGISKSIVQKDVTLKNGRKSVAKHCVLHIP